MVTKKPPVSSIASAATRRRTAFSSAHSVADRGSLDHVAPPGVQQPVEAAGGALAEVHPLDEDGAEAPHGGVANDPEAGRAAADDEDVTFEGLDQPPPSSSTQSNDLVTAFFQNR